MNGRKNIAAIFQGPTDRHVHRESDALEDAVMLHQGVQVRVKVTEHEVVIRAKSYRDYLFAREIIRNRSSLPVVQG